MRLEPHMIVPDANPCSVLALRCTTAPKQCSTILMNDLERDRSRREYDIYTRLIVWIWLDDTTLFNQKIITDGYAFEYTDRLPY
jgi:hypothetical protein